MSSDNVFKKDNIDIYLKELGKIFRKWNGTAVPAELILIGGAAILVNYGFRDMTTDIDAIIQASSSMKDAINFIGDKYELPNGWLNADFTRTGSYSPKLIEVSVPYKTFSNVLRVRTISAEYLVAMKLRSGRQYKNDLSDVIGILAEQERRGDPLTFERIDSAVKKLYETWDDIPDYSRQFLDGILKEGNYAERYLETQAAEQRTKGMLIDFEQNYPHVANDSNLTSIIQGLQKKEETPKSEKRESVLAQLKEAKDRDKAVSQKEISHFKEER